MPMAAFRHERWRDGAQALLWLGASALLARRNSFWTPVAMVALGAWFAALRQRKERRYGKATAEAHLAQSGATLVISPPREAEPFRPLLGLIAAGMMINLAMLAQGTGRAVAAGVFGGLASAVVMRRLPADALARLNRASVAMATVLIAIGLMRWGTARLFGIPADDPDATTAVLASTGKANLTFRGVILLAPKPEKAPDVPPLAVLRADERQKAAARKEPLVIPFSGVYWLFHRPDAEPPATSLAQYGAPDALFFRAADHRPLVMEAHQHVGRHIDLSCCASIEVDIVNVDRYPGSVRAELVVADTAYPVPVRQRIGSQPVTTTPRWPYDEAAAQEETLRFPIPTAPAGSVRFDRISVRFHLDAVRNTRSARMAIRKFTLIPR